MVKANAKNTQKRNSLFNFNRRKVSLVIFLGFVTILCAGFISGINQWTMQYITCGGALVVITHQIASPLSERLYPGDKSYGPDFYNSYKCMTAEEKAGKRY